MPLATLEFDPADAKIALLTLRRDDARNALSFDMLSDLHACVDGLKARCEASAGPVVCVVSGAGKAFCAGMDLKAVLEDAHAAKALLHSLADLVLKLRALPVVSVASVRGAAIGGGCGLACVCDIAITHADSKMGFPEVDLGVCPGVVASVLMRKIGPGPARRVLLSGGLLSGQQAHAIGMADHCVATPGELDDATQALAKRLAQGGPQALRATKDLLNQLDGSLDADQVRAGADLSASIVSSDATRTILRAKLGLRT